MDTKFNHDKLLITIPLKIIALMVPNLIHSFSGLNLCLIKITWCLKYYGKY